MWGLSHTSEAEKSWVGRRQRVRAETHSHSSEAEARVPKPSAPSERVSFGKEMGWGWGWAVGEQFLSQCHAGGSTWTGPSPPRPMGLKLKPVLDKAKASAQPESSPPPPLGLWGPPKSVITVAPEVTALPPSSLRPLSPVPGPADME